MTMTLWVLNWRNKMWIVSNNRLLTASANVNSTVHFASVNTIEILILLSREYSTNFTEDFYRTSQNDEILEGKQIVSWNYCELMPGDWLVLVGLNLPPITNIWLFSHGRNFDIYSLQIEYQETRNKLVVVPIYMLLRTINTTVYDLW